MDLENANDCDGDGHVGRGDEATDCDDTDPNVNADAEEIWYNGADDNCDSHNDYDQDLMDNSLVTMAVLTVMTQIH